MRITNDEWHKNEETEDDLKSPVSQKHDGYTPAEKQKQAQARKTADANK